jgi:hypothetical protein
MKAIDFTKPGGFPLAQDQLNYLQQAYTESITALGAMGGSGTTPYIISGAVLSNPSSGTYIITDGWLMYGGEMIRLIGGGISGVFSGHDPYIQITSSATSVTFNDGSTPNVILEKTAHMVSMTTGTAEDSTHFMAIHLVPFGIGFGLNNREQSWSSLAVTTAAIDGGVTGTIYYKKDFTANTLQVRGLLSANNAQNFAASPSALFYLMGTLPGTYAPNNAVYFIASYFVSSLIKDDLNIGWIKQVNCAINTSGQFFVNWIKPDAAILSYGLNFNTIIPLD